MPGQETAGPPVIVTFPAQLDAATADHAAGQITAALTPGVSVVIADLAAAACCDRSAIRHLLKAHRKAITRGGQVRFVIRPGGPLHRITDFAGSHPLLAVYPTLRHALADRPLLPSASWRPADRKPTDDVLRSGLTVGRRSGLAGVSAHAAAGSYSALPEVMTHYLW